MHRRSSSGMLSAFWRQRKLDHFKKFMLDRRIIQECSDWSPYGVSEVGRKFLSGVSGPDTKILRLILPYRQEVSNLPKKFTHFASEWLPYLEGETGMKFEMKVSWSSGGRPLKSLLSDNNR